MFSASRVIRRFFDHSVRSRCRRGVRSTIGVVTGSSITLFFNVKASNLVTTCTSQRFSGLNRDAFRVRSPCCPFRLVDERCAGAITVVYSISKRARVVLEGAKSLGDLKDGVVDVAGSSAGSLTERSSVGLTCRLAPRCISRRMGIASRLPTIFLVRALTEHGCGCVRRVLGGGL